MAYKIEVTINNNGRIDMSVTKGEWSYILGETWLKFLELIGELEPNIRFPVYKESERVKKKRCDCMNGQAARTKKTIYPYGKLWRIDTVTKGVYDFLEERISIFIKYCPFCGKKLPKRK